MRRREWHGGGRVKFKDAFVARAFTKSLASEQSRDITFAAPVP